MAGLAALAIAVGAIASFRLPVLLFATCLAVASCLSAGVGWAFLPRSADAAVAAAILFVCGQVGYGLGFAVAALTGSSSKSDPS